MLALYRQKQLKNHTFWDQRYLYSPHKEETPPPNLPGRKDSFQNPARKEIRCCQSLGKQ